MTNQSEKNEILLKVKGLQKKITLATTDITGMKSVSNKLEKQNELLKLLDEVKTNQSQKDEILVKIKGLQKKIDLVTTDITGMKYSIEKPDRQNELLAEARNTKPILMKLYAMRILKY